jgi:hypothetical protein
MRAPVRSSRALCSVVPLHQRRHHLLDRRDVPRALGVLFRRMIQQGLGLVHQPPVWGPQGLGEGVEGIVLPSVLAEIGVEAVEGVVSLPGPALQVLPLTGKAREDWVRESTNAEESKRRNYETQRKTTNLEDAPRGTAMDPQRLVQRSVERSAVVAELRPQLLLRLGLDEVGWRCAGSLQLLLRCAVGPPKAGRAARDDEAPAPSAAPPPPAPRRHRPSPRAPLSGARG